MPTEIETMEIELDGWVFRVRPGSTETGPARLLVQLHGWTGNETVMWIFTRRVPPDTWILSPRAPFPAQQGGYSWLENRSGLDAPLSAYQTAVSGLLQRIDTWKSPPGLDKTRFSLIGFSQGAALSYALALHSPQRVTRLASLAGFLPVGAASVSSPDATSFQGKPVFIAHGTKDERVPVERAQASVRFFHKLGAQVTYCESDVGHKLSVDCFKGLEEFFR